MAYDGRQHMMEDDLWRKMTHDGRRHMMEDDLLYVRSILEFNCCVWHFSLTKGQEEELERVQKVACKIILKDQYISYENALETLKLENLSQRRTKLCKRFALNSLRYEKSKDMFPLDKGRNRNKYKVNFARHSRLLNSAIPQMQRLLNQ